MSTNKTKPGNESALEIIQGLESERKRNDSEKLLKIFSDETGENPVICGGSMIGFGTYTYKYKSGRTGEWFRVGFAPRKANISLYLMMRPDGFEEQLSTLGKFKQGKGCIYVNKLDDINLEVLKKLIKDCFEVTKHGYTES